MQKEDTGWSNDRTLDKPAHLTVIWFSTNRMTMPQGGTYPDPECFWDAAVLQFVAPAAAEKEKALRRSDISKQNLVQITPSVTTNRSS